MEVGAILNMIPKNLLAKIGENTSVDHSVQRFRGRVTLELLLYGSLRSSRLSTHVLEEHYNSPIFDLLSTKDKGHQTRHSSIASRLQKISPDYFQQIFEWSYHHYFNNYGGSKFMKKLTRYDSTLINISSALVDWGMKVGRIPENSPRKVQLKVSLGLKGNFPKTAEIHTTQEYLSEENALKQIILQNDIEDDEIISFDAGLKSRKTLKTFDNKGFSFVTRGADNLRYEVIETSDELPEDTDKLKFVQDSRVYLFSNNNEKVEHEFRLIEAYDIENDKTLYFITNIWDLSADMIALIYKHRWDIEVFFKFLKQELNIKHFLSHSLNGIKVQIYVALILAILLTIFKVANNLKGYKIPKIRFEEQLLWHIFNELAELKVRQKSYDFSTSNSSF